VNPPDPRAVRERTSATMARMKRLFVFMVLGTGCNPFCGTEDVYDIDAEITVRGQTIPARVVYANRQTRGWLSGLGDACGYDDAGEVLLFEPAGGGLVILPVHLCGRARAKAGPDGTSDLRRHCVTSPSAPEGWLVDSAHQPTRWRGIGAHDGITLTKLTATPSWSWWPRDDLHEKGPGLLRAEFVNHTTRGQPGFNAQSPARNLERAQDWTRVPVVYDASLALVASAGVTP
jgi:hypothetical protein